MRCCHGRDWIRKRSVRRARSGYPRNGSATELRARNGRLNIARRKRAVRGVNGIACNGRIELVHRRTATVRSGAGRRGADRFPASFSSPSAAPARRNPSAGRKARLSVSRSATMTILVGDFGGRCAAWLRSWRSVFGPVPVLGGAGERWCQAAIIAKPAEHNRLVWAAGTCMP